MTDMLGTDKNPNKGSEAMRWLLSAVPILQWMRSYKKEDARHDLVAGVTHAAYSVPEGLVNASLAGLPAQHGLYSFLIGGLFYTLFTTSRHAAVAATSTLSIMVGYTLGTMGLNDPTRYVEFAAATAVLAGFISLLAWVLRLSEVVNFISETILSGFRAGAALVIAASQLPKILGIATTGHNFFQNIYGVFQNLGDTNLVVLSVGAVALMLLFLGQRWISKGIVSLAVVALSIGVMSFTNLTEYGVKITGDIPAGFPSFGLSRLSITDIVQLLPVALGCFLLAYVEGISMMRTFASKHTYAIDSRQELLAQGAANLAVGLGQGFPVAVGLSQTIVNEQAGARTPVANVFAISACALVLLFFTGLFHNLPQAVLAAMILVAAKSLVNVHELNHLRRVSKREFAVALVTLSAVLVFGILWGVLVATVVSLLMLIHALTYPSVSILGRIPGTDEFGDITRHPENETVEGVLACRVDGPLLYFNANNIWQEIVEQVRKGDPPIKLVLFDLSTVNVVDLTGARMVRDLDEQLSSQGIELRVVSAHGQVRDLLRLEGLAALLGRIDPRHSLDIIMKQIESDTGKSLREIAYPGVSILGRIPGTDEFGEITRHPENETVEGVLACRVDGPVLHFNANNILQEMLDQVREKDPAIKLVIFDLSTTNFMDPAGARMVQRLDEQLSSQGIELRLVRAHGRVRDMLRSEGLAAILGRIDPRYSLDMIMKQVEHDREES